MVVDKEVVGWFINQGRNNKFVFEQAYAKWEYDLKECPTVGYSMRGATVLVTRGHNFPVLLVIALSKRLEMGIHHVICHLFCPGFGTAHGNRDVQRFKLWLIGILCTNQRRDGPTNDNDWAQHKDIMEPWLKEDVVFGIKYSADNLRLAIHIDPNGACSRKFIGKHYMLDKTLGGLFIAAESSLGHLE
jgi:hypothetical protein